MAVSIVTDSTSDIPPAILRELDITVVPLNVHFGEEVYRDRVDISEEEFFRRLPESHLLPKTSQPSVGDFAETYEMVAQRSDAIVSVHISAKLSGTINSALQAKQLFSSTRIEVVDSQTTSMAMGLMAMAAARAAKAGASADELVDQLRRLTPRSKLYVFFDTLTYLAKGGRIGKVQSLVGSVLSFKPIITCQSGELLPVARPRTRHRAIEGLYELVEAAPAIDELAVVYSTPREEAEALSRRLERFCPRERIHICQVGPVLGAHIGPGAVGVCFLEGEQA